MGDEYDLIFANAVLLHFNKAELASVLSKAAPLAQEGRPSHFQLEAGTGQGVVGRENRCAKALLLLEQAELEPPLVNAGFTQWTIGEALTGRAYAEWLFVIALKP